jgi:hypothetical protein
VAAGADGSLGGYRLPPGFSDLDRYWPEPVATEPSPPGAALDLLERSIEMGATVVGVGPWTNLALLEAARPGLLASTRLVVLGGYVRPVRAGLPTSAGAIHQPKATTERTAVAGVWRTSSEAFHACATTCEGSQVRWEGLGGEIGWMLTPRVQGFPFPTHITLDASFSLW